MIIDSHTHIFPKWLRDERERYLARDNAFHEMYADPKAKMATADDLIAAMDEDGVDLSIVVGIGWTDQGLTREVNNYFIEAMSQYPGRIVAFAGVNPVWGDAAAKEVERCALAGIKGIGELHPDPQGFNLGNNETMAPLMEVVRHFKLMVNVHSSEPVGHVYCGKGTARPEMLWQFITGHQDITILCSHWGGGLPFYALMPEVSFSLESVFFDSAASPFLYEPKVFSVVADLVGADHILLGSDYPLIKARRIIKQVRESVLTIEDKDAILGTNAARLLRLEHQ